MKQISGERVWSEIQKILAGDNPAAIMQKIATTGVAGHIGLPVNRISTLQKIQTQAKSPLIRLAAMLDNTYDLEEIKARWKISNNEFNITKFIIDNRDTPLDEKTMKGMIAKSKTDRTWLKMLALYQRNQKLAQLARSWTLPTFPITGQDLITAGVKQGPEMGKLINVMKQKWVDSNYTLDKAALLRIIKIQ